MNGSEKLDDDSIETNKTGEKHLKQRLRSAENEQPSQVKAVKASEEKGSHGIVDRDENAMTEITKQDFKSKKPALSVKLVENKDIDTLLLEDSKLGQNSQATDNLPSSKTSKTMEKEWSPNSKRSATKSNKSVNKSLKPAANKNSASIEDQAETNCVTCKQDIAPNNGIDTDQTVQHLIPILVKKSRSPLQSAGSSSKPLVVDQKASRKSDTVRKEHKKSKSPANQQTSNRKLRDRRGTDDLFNFLGIRVFPRTGGPITRSERRHAYRRRTLIISFGQLPHYTPSGIGTRIGKRFLRSSASEMHFKTINERWKRQRWKRIGSTSGLGGLSRHDIQLVRQRQHARHQRRREQKRKKKLRSRGQTRSLSASSSISSTSSSAFSSSGSEDSASEWEPTSDSLKQGSPRRQIREMRISRSRVPYKVPRSRSGSSSSVGAVPRNRLKLPIISNRPNNAANQPANLSNSSHNRSNHPTNLTARSSHGSNRPRQGNSKKSGRGLCVPQ